MQFMGSSLARGNALTDRKSGYEIVTLRVVFDFETRLPANVLHRMILRQDVPDDSPDFFPFANVNQTLQHFSSEALALPGVADDQCEFRVLVAAKFAQSTNTQNFRI